MVRDVKVWFLGLVAAVSAVGWADRVVFVPAGRKLLEGEYRIEAINVAGRDHTFGWAAFSPNSVFEFGVYGENFDSHRVTWGFNGSYTLTNPITDLSPGISFGFLDLGNETEAGRAVYLAVTYRLGNDGLLNQFLPTDLSFGFWSRESGLMFAGAELPFSSSLSVLGEYDGSALTAGLVLTPVSPLKVKFLWRDGDPALGLQFRAQF